MSRWAYKLALLRGLLMGDRAYAGPAYVNIDVTHRCNLQCYYCRWHSPLAETQRLQPTMPKDLSPDTFAALCAELRAMGTRTVQFVGAGEPLLHPHIFELIRIAKACDLAVLMYTNGTLLRAERLRSLMASGLDVLRVSLAATSNAEYVRKHPHATPGEFDRIVAGMRLLARRKTEVAATRPVVEMTHPIARDGAASIADAAELAHVTGCARLHFSVMLDFGEEGIRPFTLPDDQVAEVHAHLRQAGRRLAALGIAANVEQVVLRYRIGASVWDHFPCYTAWYGSFVATDGGVHVCQRSADPVGTLAENRFGEIWNNPAYRAFRRQSLSGAPPASWLRRTDCRYCPHAVNNHRVHRAFRRVAALRVALTARGRQD
ncbi:MAG: radical SAM protein [Candidatus Binatia bacterium]